MTAFAIPLLGLLDTVGINALARIEKFDRKRPIDDGTRLTNQLIQPLFDNRAVTSVIDV